MFPKYRNIYLPALTSAKIKAISNKSRIPVIILTSAIEQHGPHLPVGVDAFLGQAWLNSTLPKLAKKSKVLIGPQIIVGSSNEHIGYPGTLSISAKTLHNMLIAVAEQIKKWGFHTIIFLNTHGGNVSVGTYTLEEIEEKLGLKAFFLHWYYIPNEISEREKKFGIHAGEIESSIIYAVTEKIADPQKANCEWIGDLNKRGDVHYVRSKAACTWLTSDIAPSGTMGDATKATVKNGLKWLNEGSTELAKKIDAICLKITSPKTK